MANHFVGLGRRIRTEGSLSASPSLLPFPTWCRIQREYGRKHLFPESVSTPDLQPSVQGFWGNVENTNTGGNTDIPEVIRNYAGLYQQLERDGTLLQYTDQLDGTGSDIIKSAKRFGLIEISISVSRGRLHFDLAYNRHMEKQKEIKESVMMCWELLIEMAKSARIK